MRWVWGELLPFILIDTQENVINLKAYSVVIFSDPASSFLVFL